MAELDKPLVWLEGDIKTPPFSAEARVEAGFLLRRLQQRELLSPRPMPAIGARCHELRVNDERETWRIIYRLESDAVVILDVFSKKTPATPKAAIKNCQQRLAAYLAAVSGKE